MSCWDLITALSSGLREVAVFLGGIILCVVLWNIALGSLNAWWDLRRYRAATRRMRRRRHELGLDEPVNPHGRN